MKKYINIYTFLIILFAFSSQGWAQSDSTEISKEKIISKINIAYGVQEKNNVSSSVSVLPGKELLKGSVTNFGNSLFGRFPGLFVDQNGGEPDYDSPTIRLRGATVSPLVIIDGFERDMTYIAPEEIESVAVLKDASALALYGMKGSNGAILITTKRGVSQKDKITFTVQSGVQTIENTMEVLGASQYMSLYNQAAQNDGLPVKYSASDLSAAGTSPRYPDVDWKDLLLRKVTNVSKANLGITGGSDFIRYFVNFGFLYNNGIYKPENPDMNSNANLMRMNVRSNIDISVSKNTLFSMDLAGSLNKNQFPAFSAERIWTGIQTLPPNAFNDKNPDGSYGGTSVLLENPLGMLETGGSNESVGHFLNASFRLRQKFDFIAKGLSASLGYVIDNGANNGDGNWRYFLVRQIQPGTGDEYQYNSYGENTQYNQWSNASSNRYTIFDGDITYNMPEANGNKLDVVVRYQTDQQYRANSDLSPYLTNNFGGRLQYAKNDTYLLELAASYFGSDQYAEGNKYGFFPAASAGWVFSNETFGEDSSWISYGKLRASYGINGYNRYVNGRYPYIQFYNNGGSFPLGTNWDYMSGLQPAMLANPDIKWEESRKLDIGMDMEFYNSIALEADFYINKRSNVLNYNFNHPSVTGATIPWENIGEVTDRGFDLKLGYTSTEKNGFVWYADLVFSYYKNQVDEMGESLNTGTLTHLNRTGNSVSAIFGLETNGYYMNESEIQGSPKQSFGTPRNGDLKYKDQNKDNLIDSRDYVVIGDSRGNMDLGLRLGAEFGNFDVETFVQGRFNNDINLSYNVMAQPFIHGNAANEIVLEDGFPKLSLTNMNNYQPSDYWIRNGDFIKIRNLELGYTLPETLLANAKIKNVRFFARGINVLTLSKWKYSDPEFTSIGYPPMKSYLLGVNVNF